MLINEMSGYHRMRGNKDTVIRIADHLSEVDNLTKGGYTGKAKNIYFIFKRGEIDIRRPEGRELYDLLNAIDDGDENARAELNDRIFDIGARAGKAVAFEIVKDQKEANKRRKELEKEIGRDSKGFKPIVRSDDPDYITRKEEPTEYRNVRRVTYVKGKKVGTEDPNNSPKSRESERTVKGKNNLKKNDLIDSNNNKVKESESLLVERWDNESRISTLLSGGALFEASNTGEGNTVNYYEEE